MTRFIIGAALIALPAVGLMGAAPANADLTPGIYLYRSVMANGVTTDVRLRVDDCGPGCISLFNLDTNTDQGQARIQGAQYVLDQFVPGGATCADGRAVDITARYTFNLDGTNGLYTLNGPNPCEAGPVGNTTFTLTPV
ncbi:hypothetical protein [Mycobacterium sp. 1274761.0]|uniref:hypothetical protein n=1 Tax=Mycobacterium sp. 1274761.0 TaxID=1834077 RepID=UPI000A483A25|nr:hypothetical protein [Mycobacterium sp. 1274761.0]